MSVHWDPYLEAIDIPPSFECMPAGELESMLNDSIDPDDGQYPPKPEGSALPDSRLSITTEYRPFDALSSPSITDTQLTPSSGYSWLPGEGDGSYGGNEDGADMNSLDVSPISNTSPTATDELAGFVFVERPQPGIPDMVGPGGHLSHLGQHPTSLPSAGPVSAAHSSRAASLVPTQGDATSYRGSYQTNPPSRMDGRYTSPQDSSFVPTALEELGEIDSFATPHDLSTKPFAFVGTTFDPSLGNAALSFPSSQERMQSLAQQDQQQYQQQYLQQHHYQHHHLQQLQTQPQQSLSAVTASQPWQSLPLDTAQLPMHQWTSHPQAITTQILMPHQFQQQQQQQQQHLQQHHLHHHQHRHHVLGPHDHPQHSMLWSSTAALGAGEMLTDSHYIHTTAIQPDPHEATISPASIPVLRSHPESHVTSTATTESAAAPLPIQHRSSATRPRASNRPRTRPLAPGNASHLTAARSATTATGRKGGREKGSHLAEAARAQAHSQRKLGACWGCALQRDPVCASYHTLLL
ncbi:hypothetical protein K431DRAFT_79390 [Polychaeton citri CBS 116435]|uniref:Uncharacterized protein n=1 Tax=Polychaeton citri CBS 116435 TaxID=1314669 RepID=A0A9P4UUV6_9PEZI|nr:hypothetical protein K431DRAFT_79390 [Polychaeton citri CBS 116435]